MTAARATWLTWKLHRFEVVVAVALMGMLAISAWIVITGLTGLAVPSGCWDQVNLDGSEVTEWCQGLLDRYHQVTGTEGALVLLGLEVVPLAAGLVAGVPVVAREVELRTTGLAWALEGRRWRWLLARSLPMLLVVAAGLVVLGGLGQRLLPMMSPGLTWDTLGDLGVRGSPLVTRGLAAMSLALLAGAVLGRTLSGMLVALVLALGLATFDSTFVPNTVARGFAAWVPVAETRTGYVRSFAVRPFGATDEETDAEAEDVGLQGDEYELLAVPASAVPTLEAIQAAIDLSIGGLAFAGTFVVVARRRPD